MKRKTRSYAMIDHTVRKSQQVLMMRREKSGLWLCCPVSSVHGLLSRSQSWPVVA